MNASLPDTRCPVCQSPVWNDFLRRENVPVHQNILCSNPDRARAIRRGNLTMAICRQCGFAFNRTFDASLLEYGAEYDNTQTHSAVFEQHLTDLVQRLTQQRGVRNCTIVEVGCGKGDFLRRLVAPEDLHNRGCGFDPSYEGPEAECGGRLVFQRQFYDERSPRVPADAIVCRHVIEHIAAPQSFLQSFHRALADSPGGRVFLETPCLDWILRHGVLWDFFYEHCSLFTATSLSAALARAGFEVESVSHVFDGQYLWAEAVRGIASEPLISSAKAANSAHWALHFGIQEQAQLAACRSALQPYAPAGGVALWGAGAKGVTFAQLIDPQSELIRCVVDINPRKQGKFLPGSGLPIVAPAELAGSNVPAVVVLNPNYRAEVAELLRQLDLHLPILDAMSLPLEALAA